MLQVGKKKEKHEFETNDVKAARDWVRALELEVSSLNPLRVHNCWHIGERETTHHCCCDK